MEDILFISGSSDINDKIDKLNLDMFGDLAPRIFTLSTLSRSNKPFLRISSDKLSLLIGSKSTRIRSDIHFISDIARVCHRSFSLRTRIKIELCWHYRIRNIQTLKSFLKYLCSKKVLLMYLFFFYGILRLPKQLLMFFLKIRLKDHLKLAEIFDSLNLSQVVLFTSGYDNLVFLLSAMNRNDRTKFTIVISNWDNTSSKAIVPKFFDKICLWNYDQINEIAKFSKLKTNNLFVLGSKTADNAYSAYDFSKDSRSKNKKNSLLFIGQQNKCDEIGELIKINEFLSSNSTPYENLVYRPHPLSGHQQKMIGAIQNKNLKIDLDLSPSIDLRNYSGIIGLPTTFLLEAILSQVPMVVYTPRHENYRRDPYTTWKYYHWNTLKKILPSPVLSNFQELCLLLTNGIPSQRNLSINEFNQIFPKFDNSFESRLNKIISSY
jgi:hypothetical protein